VDFGEFNDKAIKELMYLSKNMSRFYLYILEKLMENLFVVEYYMAHKDKYMDDPNAYVTNIKQ
jgi:hypothetical protein